VASPSPLLRAISAALPASTKLSQQVAKMDCAGRFLDLSTPKVMGILNVTPDSFSDGGDFFSPEKALLHARQMVAEGADIIDVGGESTRPGAVAVSVRDESRRVVPIIAALVSELQVLVSIDTSKPEVMAEAVQAGAAIINDVNALQAEGALEMAASLGVPVCLMHMQGGPRTMQLAPCYQDVAAEVEAFLCQRIAACEQAGIPRERLVIDPGFGFGKTLAHNVALFRQLDRFVAIGVPVLVGVSRKSMIGAILDASLEQRLYGGTALATLAAWWGAAIIRTHDVKATVDAIKICNALKG